MIVYQCSEGNGKNLSPVPATFYYFFKPLAGSLVSEKKNQSENYPKNNKKDYYGKNKSQV